MEHNVLDDGCRLRQDWEGIASARGVYATGRDWSTKWTCKERAMEVANNGEAESECHDLCQARYSLSSISARSHEAERSGLSEPPDIPL